MNEVRRNLLRKAKTKALMITVVIMIAFVICWVPYYSTMIIFIFLKPDTQLSQDLQSAVFFFGSSTAMINPLIYGAFHLRRGAPRHRAPTHSSASSRAENTVMQVVVRKKRNGSDKIQYVLPVVPQNGNKSLKVKLGRQQANSLCSLHSPREEEVKQQEHSL